MKKIAISITCLMLLIFHGYAQNTIAEARAMPEGTTVTVRGVVTNGSELGNSIRYFQDATAGIAAYKGGAFGTIARGDSIVVTGVLKNYNQLLELDPVTSFTAIAPKPLPAPILLTPGGMGEAYEGRLITMVGVSFTNGGGTFQGNTNYNVTANGETCQVRVNIASTGPTGLVGQIIPASPVTIVGICSQFDYNNPAAGYQFLLRDKNDIISNSTIAFTTPLAISNITTSSFTLNWSTNIAGTTELFYGRTPQLELGHISGTGSAATHSIDLTGLNPSDLVYVIAFSVAGSDTGFSGLKPYITRSVSTGKIVTYFTRPVDTTVATGPKAIRIYRATDDTCIAYINRAKSSVDVAIYNFNYEGIADIASALNAAHTRGVIVRLVGDADQNNSAIPRLNAAIGKILRPAGSGIMHNKFMVIDANSTNANDPIVWTGSCNWTDQNVNTDANNNLFIQDASLARVYTLEFNEMFGSAGPTPNVAMAKFGPAKSDNTPHELVIGGKRVEVYFSPSDGVNGQLVAHINTTDSEIEVGTMLMTQTVISDAIIARHNAGASAKVIISNRSTSPQVITALTAALGNDFREYHEPGMLHSKMMIVDRTNLSSDPFVWTGSHNWSASANTSNDENTIVIHDAAVCDLFYQEWSERSKLSIAITEHPVLDLGPDQTVYGSDVIQLDAGQFTTYVWSTGEFTQLINVDSSGVGFGTKKIYCRVTDSYGVQSDTVLITFKPNDAIGEANSLISRLQVYPNPSDGNFTMSVDASKTQSAAVEVTSIDGKQCYNGTITLQTGKNSFRMAEMKLRSGLYLLKLKTPEGIMGTKVLIY